MFTGIIGDLGRVRAVKPDGDTRFEFSTGFDTATLDIGASVACSGVCLTAIDKGRGWFAVDVSAETLARTALGAWRKGTPVNLERSLRVGDELGGHLVAGHVDGVATLIAAEDDGRSRRLVFEAPKELKRLIAVKGSIAVDGVSLTVNGVRSARFSVNVIPHTLKATTLGGLAKGACVNVEIDLLARYVARHSERD
ncbi:MAG: riboflavin synthase subunit alpha [Rhodospirillales bacterium RIFCSPLOWO2_01_FULL_65_14]|nr:MAG: riboflavin synthase subunit alpha [Rhodospirillales bacterium RIFCSPLOWO2_01_FULL_65_14]